MGSWDRLDVDGSALTAKLRESWDSEVNAKVKLDTYNFYDEVAEASSQLLHHLGQFQGSEALTDVDRLGFLAFYKLSASAQAALDARAVHAPTFGDQAARGLSQIASSGVGSAAYTLTRAGGADEQTARNALAVGTVAGSLFPVGIAAARYTLGPTAASQGRLANGGRSDAEAAKNLRYTEAITVESQAAAKPSAIPQAERTTASPPSTNSGQPPLRASMSTDGRTTSASSNLRFFDPNASSILGKPGQLAQSPGGGADPLKPDDSFELPYPMCAAIYQPDADHPEITAWSSLRWQRPANLTDEQWGRLQELNKTPPNKWPSPVGAVIERALLTTPNRLDLSRQELYDLVEAAVLKAKDSLELVGYSSSLDVTREETRRNFELLKDGRAFQHEVSPKLSELLANMSAPGGGKKIAAFFKSPTPQRGAVLTEIWNHLKADREAKGREWEHGARLGFKNDYFGAHLRLLVKDGVAPFDGAAFNLAVVNAEFGNLAEQYPLMSTEQLARMVDRKVRHANHALGDSLERAFPAEGDGKAGLDNRLLDDKFFEGTSLAVPQLPPAPYGSSDVREIEGWALKALDGVLTLDKQYQAFNVERLHYKAAQRSIEVAKSGQELAAFAKQHPQAMAAICDKLTPSPSSLHKVEWDKFDGVGLIVAKHQMQFGPHKSMKGTLSEASLDRLKEWKATIDDGLATLEEMPRRFEGKGLEELKVMLEARIESSKFARDEIILAAHEIYGVNIAR